MGKLRRSHSPQFKFDVAFKAMSTNQPAETARLYGITTGMVTKWVAYIKANGPHLFETHPDKEVAQLKTHVEKLEQIVGKKEVELSLMKNFVDFYTSPSGK